MTGETFTALVNLGSAGAVIIVVVYMLKFVTELRSQDRETTEKLITTVQALTQELVNLRRDFDVAVATMKERTQPRSKTPPKIDTEG